MTDLVEITPDAYSVRLDIRYATSSNFTGEAVYTAAKCFLHHEAAEKLQAAVKLAEAIGYQLKIFDAFRPTEAQWKLWEHTPDPDFLADPNRGSPHSRGVAVDLTRCNMDGVELDMGTEFDEFSELSHHGNQEVSPEAQRNRHVLMGIMTTAGWDFFRNEWWHYQLFNSRDYMLYSDEEAGAEMMKRPSLIGRFLPKL